MNKRFLTIASGLGAASVILGAFAAHGLKAVLSPEYLSAFETAVRYQFYHAFALIAVAVLTEKISNKWVHWAGNCFIAGIILFCGSLYLLTALRISETGGARFAGMITPVGGVFLIAGWVCLLIGVSSK
jgi:uncharacterized membrane protein YgdD (TMEM256/DUF423 family)